jgi:DNA-binding NtrC family response regulator
METASGRTEKVDVLVVDDDASITELLQLELRREFDVRAAQSVGEALRAMRRQVPDVVVTDLEMDEGGGEHLLPIVKFLHPEVVRVVFSAASLSKLRRVVDSGLADAAVEKGMDLQPLKDTLAALFGSRMAQAERAAVAVGSFPDLVRHARSSSSAR